MIVFMFYFIFLSPESFLSLRGQSYNLFPSSLTLLTNKLECLLLACQVSLFYVRWATGISLVHFFFITDALDK